jgi:hypothetical protein
VNYFIENQMIMFQFVENTVLWGLSFPQEQIVFVQLLKSGTFFNKSKNPYRLSAWVLAAEGTLFL